MNRLEANKPTETMENPKQTWPMLYLLFVENVTSEKIKFCLWKIAGQCTIWLLEYKDIVNRII